MHTNIGGCGLSSFGDTATFKNGLTPSLPSSLPSSLPLSPQDGVDDVKQQKFFCGVDWDAVLMRKSLVSNMSTVMHTLCVYMSWS